MDRLDSFRFSQQVSISGRIFKQGINEVPEEVQEHPDFLHFVRCGWIEDAPPPVVAAQPVALNEQAKRLAERIQKKMADRQEKIRKDAEKAEDATDKDTDSGDDEDLSPQQRGARTRKANAGKANASRGA